MISAEIEKARLELTAEREKVLADFKKRGQKLAKQYDEAVAKETEKAQAETTIQPESVEADSEVGNI